MVKEGWICPKCGRALAPWVKECPCWKTQTIETEIAYPVYDVLDEVLVSSDDALNEALLTGK